MIHSVFTSTYFRFFSLFYLVLSSERVASMMMNKPLGKATIATLEKVFETIRYPDDDVLRSA